ncbi:MAG: hypothetical protein LRY51_15630 [Geovibrio sp.]|jgi:hypothetical protein|uniref:hypothetical protein n=1 Tax=Geovibrio ferrireducens TaxID=46201 RepID=UPI002245E749|nr:hypothetical protein [Geovibrio ferrireducens]MCD8493203.1 hypothetical protein [Geovibrio sp.]
MEQKTRYGVGDIFRIYDRALESYRNVILVRIIITEEHFYLLSMHSFEPWSERVLSTKDIFKKTSLTIDEVSYLADSVDITYLGNAYELKEEFDGLLLNRVAK